MNNWIVFTGKDSGKELCKITTLGYMKGEIAATKELLKEEKGEETTIHLEYELKSLGYADDWSRPMYKDCHDQIYVDVNCGDGEIDIHTTTNDGTWNEPVSSITNYTIINETVET